MELQWWMLLPLIPLAGLAWAVFKVTRIRRRGRPFLELSRAERLEFGRIMLRDPNLPIVPRVLVAVAAAYLALPLDLIPDFVPVIGHADDFVVVTLLMAVMTRTLPKGVFEETVRRVRLDPAQRAIPVN